MSWEKNQHYRKGMIAADLSKQKALDADSKAIQQTVFTDKLAEVIFTKN